MYKTKTKELAKELIGEDAEDEQKQHLEDTMHPSNMNVVKYVERVEENNAYIK